VKRLVLPALLLAVLLPGCRSAGPKTVAGPAAPPDLLKDYVGQLRVLRYQGDRQSVEVGPQDRLSGQCDVAVEVRGVSFERGQARFSLETVGLPSVKGREPRCEKTQPGIRLAVSGFEASPGVADVTPRVDAVLQTPNAYLQSMGIAFDREAAAEPPTDLASKEVDASSVQRALARRVSVWPQELLTVETWYRDPAGRLRQQSVVEMDAVVGTDGRVYDPRIKTGLSDVHQRAITRALKLWRFEPARKDEDAVAARIELKPILRIY